MLVYSVPRGIKDKLALQLKIVSLYQLHQKRVSYGHQPNHLYEINLTHNLHRENSRCLSCINSLERCISWQLGLEHCSRQSFGVKILRRIHRHEEHWHRNLVMQIQIADKAHKIAKVFNKPPRYIEEFTATECNLLFAHVFLIVCLEMNWGIANDLLHQCALLYKPFLFIALQWNSNP